MTSLLTLKRVLRSKMLLFFALSFMMTSQAKAALETAELKASTIDPSEGSPEYLFTINNLFTTFLTCDLHSGAQENAGKFAFYAVPDKADCYYIYSYSRKQWVNYNQSALDKATGDGIGVGLANVLHLVDAKNDAAYFKITKTTNSSNTGYDIQPFKDGVPTYYMNFFGRSGDRFTVGYYSKGGSEDSGSLWVLSALDNDFVSSYLPGATGAATTIAGYDGYKATLGQNWKFTTPINWETQQLVVTLDLNGVFAADGSDGNRCVIGVADINKELGWHKDGVSAVWNESANELRFFAFREDGLKPGGQRDLTWSGKYVKLVWDKDKGLTINGETATDVSLLSDLFSATEIQVGTFAKNSSATYTIQLLPRTGGETRNTNTIYDNALNTFESKEGVDIVVGRTLKAGIWNTFCVPFNLSAEQIKAVLGDDVQLRAYQSCEGNVITFKEVTAINAGEPYLVKVSSAKTNPEFVGVNLVKGAPKMMGEEGTCRMVGTYSLTQLATDGTHLFLVSNKFYSPEENDATMKGLRSYFVVPSGTNYAALRVDIDGTPTSIDAIDGAMFVVVAPVYNLQGQCVGNSLDGLPRGVYVQNGKKYVVR